MSPGEIKSTPKGLDWIQHGGVAVLRYDVRGIGREQVSDLQIALHRLLEESLQPVRLLVIGDAQLDYHPDVAHSSRKLLSLPPKIKRSALVGLSGMAKTVADGYFDEARLREQDVSQRGRHFSPEGLEAALDWLARD